MFGASCVGKTAIMKNFATSLYQDEDYKPTLTEVYERSITLRSQDGKVCKHSLSLLDTSGKLRFDFPSMYRQAIISCEAFVLVFALDDENSLTEIEDILRDIDIIKKGFTSPILIIANKSDTVESNGQQNKLSKQLANINRGCCFKTSALNQSDFTESFVYLLTEIERRKGIDRSFYGVQVER